MDTSSDLREKLALVNSECQTEYQGSQVLRDIMILVYLVCALFGLKLSISRDLLGTIWMEMVVAYLG